MSSVVILFSVLVLFTACGKRETITENLVEKSVVDSKPQSPTETPIAETCRLEAIGSGYTLTCASHTILINGTTLSNIEITQDELKLTASQIVSALDESQWFDAVVKFKTEKNLRLPETISSNKTITANQKVYIRFSKNLECAWYSDEDQEYNQYRCFENATRAPETVDGFVDGTEVSVDVVEDIRQVRMHLTGQEELDTSTAKAIFSFE
jgi:hypothetical protein